MAQKIALTGVRGHVDESAVAAAAITPGYLIEYTSAGKWQKHGTAAANAAKVFALEQPHLNKGIDDDYAADDRVRAYFALPGDLINCLVAAGASNIPTGSFVESAGDGTVRILSTDAATDDTQRVSVIGYANTGVNNSGGGSEARIKITVV